MYMYACICMYAYACMYMYVCICMCVCMYYVYVCLYAYMCVYVCITYWGELSGGGNVLPKTGGELSGGVIVRGELSGGIVQGGIFLHPAFNTVKIYEKSVKRKS